MSFLATLGAMAIGVYGATKIVNIVMFDYEKKLIKEQEKSYRRMYNYGKKKVKKKTK